MPVRGIWMKMKLSRPFEQLNYHVGCLGSWFCFETSKGRKIELKKEPKTKKERIRCEMPHGVQLQSIQSVGSRLSGSRKGAQDCCRKYARRCMRSTRREFEVCFCEAAGPASPSCCCTLQKTLQECKRSVVGQIPTSATVGRYSRSGKDGAALLLMVTKKSHSPCTEA